MTRFENLDESTAPAASRAVLSEQRAKLGFLPSPLARAAASPAALGAIIGLLGRFEESSLAPAEREVLAFVLGYENGCGYCVAMHSALAARFPEIAPHVAALRRGEAPSSPRLRALAQFVRAALASTG